MNAPPQAEVASAPLEYESRFMRFGEKVVADRGYTTASLTAATLGPGYVDDIEWCDLREYREASLCRDAFFLRCYLSRRARPFLMLCALRPSDLPKPHLLS